MAATNTDQVHVYFVLPIYNEEAALPKLLEILGTEPLPPGTERTIVAVNDGSTDSSGEILAKFSERYPLEIITNMPNRGIPQTFKSAFEFVAKTVQDNDVVIVMESDCTSDPKLIPDLVKKVAAGNDIVIASRHVPGGAYVRFPWFRTAASTIVNIALRMALRIPGVEDYTIFYRAYRGGIIKRGFADGVNFQARRSFAVNGEVLLILSTLKPKIAEVPMRYDYGLKTSASSMPLIATLVEYVRLALIYRNKSY
ncbi:MAG: glycosyltransferase family 2 protein [Candidatus Obscuribacterales bacterium]